MTNPSDPEASHRWSGGIGTGPLNLLVPLFFVAMAMVLAAPVFFSGKVLFHGHGQMPPADEMAIHLPIQFEVQRRLQNGDIPLWNPWVGLGVPLQADAISLVTDPLTRMLTWLMPIPYALTWRSILMAVIAAWALFGFLRLHRVGFWGAVAAGVTYVSLVLRYPPAEELHLHYVVTDWMVVALWAFAMIRRREVFGLVGAVAIGMAAVSGHPQGLYFGLLGIAVYGISVVVVMATGAPGPFRAARMAWTGVVATTLGLALGAVQILPVMDFASIGSHWFPDPTHPEISNGYDDFVGNSWGLLGPGLVLVLFGVFHRSRRLAVGASALFLLVLWTVAGGSLVKVWHHVLPYFDNFKLGSKYFISPFPVLAAVLFGLGLDRFLVFRVPALRIVGIALAVVTFAVIPYSDLHFLQQSPSSSMPGTQKCVDQIRDVVRDGRLIRLRSDAMFPNLGIYWDIMDTQVFATQLLPSYQRLMAALNPSGLKTIADDSEVFSLSDPSVVELPVIDMLGIRAVLAGEPFVARGFKPIVNELNATCFCDDVGYFLARNTEAMQRVFLVKGYCELPSESAVLERTISPDLDPFECVLVSTSAVPQAPSDPTEWSGGSAEIESDTGDEVFVLAESDDPAVLVLADAWASGWKVEVNGEPARLMKAYGAIRAVAVPAGESKVVFSYRPAGWIVGSTVSIAALILVLLWGLVFACRRLCKRG